MLTPGNTSRKCMVRAAIVAAWTVGASAGRVPVLDDDGPHGACSEPAWVCATDVAGATVCIGFGPGVAFATAAAGIKGKRLRVELACAVGVGPVSVPELAKA